VTSLATNSTQALRPYLFSVAYRMLGVAADAEDAVQEAFLRMEESAADDIRSEKAMLTTIVTRVCLDVLKSAHHTREQYIGPWLPEPVVTDEPVDSQSISLAFLMLLERLSPDERAAYLLAEVFDYGHAEIAEILGKSEPAVRKLFSRAKQHMAEKSSRFSASKEEHTRLVSSFMLACAAGDLEGLRAVLAEEVTATSDSGGKAKAARKIVHGRDHVSRFLVGVAKKGEVGAEVHMRDINGCSSLLVVSHGVLVTVVSVVISEGVIRDVLIVRNPDKLRSVAHALGLAS